MSITNKLVFSLASLFIFGCGPMYHGEVACTSKCGLRLIEPVQIPREGVGLSCDNLNEAEDIALAELAASKDVRMITGCLAINGWSLIQWPEERKFINNGYRYVAGVTSCSPYNLIQISNISWRAGAFTHELAHAIQTCYPNYVDNEDPAHAGWKENGIFSAIDRVNNGEGWEFIDE